VEEKFSLRGTYFFYTWLGGREAETRTREFEILGGTSTGVFTSASSRKLFIHEKEGREKKCTTTI